MSYCLQLNSAMSKLYFSTILREFLVSKRANVSKESTGIGLFTPSRNPCRYKKAFSKASWVMKESIPDYIPNAKNPALIKRFFQTALRTDVSGAGEVFNPGYLICIILITMVPPF